MFDRYSDAFDEAFDAWFNSKETQNRFHYGQFDDKQIAYAAIRWALDHVKPEVTHVV